MMEFVWRWLFATRRRTWIVLHGTCALMAVGLGVLIVLLGLLLSGCGKDAMPVEYARIAPNGTESLTFENAWLFSNRMQCLDAHGAPAAKRSCAYRWSRGARVQKLYDGPELSIEWDRTLKSWVVWPKGGKVLWGPDTENGATGQVLKCLEYSRRCRIDALKVLDALLEGQGGSR